MGFLFVMDKTNSVKLLIEYLQDTMAQETKLLGLRWAISNVDMQIAELQQELGRTVPPALPSEPAPVVQKERSYRVPVYGIFALLFVIYFASCILWMFGSSPASWFGYGDSETVETLSALGIFIAPIGFLVSAGLLVSAKGDENNMGSSLI